MTLQEIKSAVDVGKTVSILDVNNVKVGDVLNFPSPRDYSKVIRRKVSGFEICNIRKDNLHIRVAYKMGKIEHQPLLEKVLELNPHLKAEPLQVQSFLREGVYTSRLHGEQTLYQECVTLKGSTAPIQRPFIRVSDNQGNPYNWYLD